MFEGMTLLGIVVFVAMLFVSISFHETMHAYVAYKLGDDLAHSHGRISLNPLNHIDPVLTILLPATMLLLGLPPILAAKPVPINTNRISGDELGLAAVGIAGPFTNLGLATVAALFMNFVVSNGTVVYDLFDLFLRLNVGLFVFNMMPIPPLDGSRLLYAFAPRPVQNVMEQIEALGPMIIIFILLVAIQFVGPILDRVDQFILNLLLI